VGQEAIFLPFLHGQTVVHLWLDSTEVISLQPGKLGEARATLVIAFQSLQLYCGQTFAVVSVEGLCRSRALAPVPCLKLDVLADLFAPHLLSTEERTDRDERVAQSGRSSSAFHARWRDMLHPGRGKNVSAFLRRFCVC
jgi:hypothetical protein